MAKKELVYSVQTVEARIDGNVLHVTAHGTARTGGWTDPELEPSSATGDVQFFRFMATPPSGPATQALTPINAKYQSGPLLPPFPQKVVVKAETNEVEAPIGK
jgi:hypothetical protein